ncbi:MAG: hypothetical protein OIF57_12500 [Marinobacterium sp.]|nr:hypothetical protein [Marinobacterium sp.]
MLLSSLGMMGAVKAQSQSSTLSIQQRYHDCMLEHLYKVHTDQAVRVLQEACQFRSQQLLSDKKAENKADKSQSGTAGKVQYCRLSGADYIEETGRCGPWNFE